MLVFCALCVLLPFVAGDVIIPSCNQTLIEAFQAKSQLDIETILGGNRFFSVSVEIEGQEEVYSVDLQFSDVVDHTVQRYSVYRDANGDLIKNTTRTYNLYGNYALSLNNTAKLVLYKCCDLIVAYSCRLYPSVDSPTFFMWTLYDKSDDEVNKHKLTCEEGLEKLVGTDIVFQERYRPIVTKNS